jgi:hypothetical protein
VRLDWFVRRVSATWIEVNLTERERISKAWEVWLICWARIWAKPPAPAIAILIMAGCEVLCFILGKERLAEWW